MKPLGPPYARPERRGRYLIRNPMKAMAMAAADLALSALPAPKPDIPRQPQRVLLCNWAHLGDVVLTFPAIARMREAFPDAQIDVLTQTGSRGVVATMPGIGRIHLLDHWGLSRTIEGMKAKRARYLKQRAAVIHDLREAGYDLAIDFYQHYPTASYELHRAGIPVRLGYTSGGFSPLLTHTVDWTTDDRHVIERHGDLIDLAMGKPRGTTRLAARYPQPPEGTMSALRSLGMRQPYVMVHTGTGGIHKEWPEDRWRTLIAELAGAGEHVVLVGAGARETERNARLAAGLPVLNLSGQADWTQFTALVANAAMLIGLDSVAVHLGAAFGTPSIVIRSGVVSNKVWGPMNDRAIQLSTPTPCYPCHRTGCDTMACLLGIEAPDAIRAFGKLAAARGANGPAGIAAPEDALRS